MADHQQNVLMVENNIPDGSVMITESQDHEDESEEVSPDILQQALQEASEGFDHTTVEYAATTNGVTVVGDQSLSTVTNLPDTTTEAADSENFMDASQNNVMDVQYNVIQTEPQTATIIAPLGSSQNPIQIIQQGNTYHSTQVLSQEQLQQIAQVLQQQQIAQGASQGGTSVLFNAQTNTRIVYRVIYPAELHARGAQNRPQNENNSVPSHHHHRGRHHHLHRKRKPWGKRFEEEEEKIDVPELSKAEKEERKRHRPRTRSGRVSKPPSHMIKDYKRIHTLDFDEDPYDDSDGGYSDFQFSENEDRSNDTYLPGDFDEITLHKTGGFTGKPRKWKCHTCDKAYIGRGGLGRHYRLNPNHGSLPPEEATDTLNGNSNTNSNSVDFLSEDSNSQTSSNLSMASSSVNNSILTTNTATSTPVTLPSTTVVVSASPTTTHSATTTIVTNSLPRGAQKARIAYLQDNNIPSRRKLRLKELIKQCDDEELMEIVMPRLAKTINVWEFLMMKTERGKPARPYFPEVYSEYENLHKKIQKMAQECLSPVIQRPGDGLVMQNGQSTILQLQNEAIAHSLGLSVGSYEVNEAQLSDDSTFQYKLLTTDPADIYRNQNSRRTVELVSPEELFVQQTHKRRRNDHSNCSEKVSNIVQSLEENISDMPDQILQDSLPEERLNNRGYQPMNGPIQKHSDILNNSTQEEMMASDDTGEPDVRVVTRLADGHVLVKAREVSDNTIEASADVIDQMLAGDQISINNETGEVICQDSTINDDEIMVHEAQGTQVIMVQNGQIIEHNVEGLTDLTGLHQSIIPGHNGVYILQNVDGTTTLQLQHGDSNIPLETVQALLDMDNDGQPTHIDQNDLVE